MSISLQLFLANWLFAVAVLAHYIVELHRITSAIGVPAFYLFIIVEYTFFFSNIVAHRVFELFCFFNSKLVAYFPSGVRARCCS